MRNIIAATKEAMDNVIFMCKEGERMTVKAERKLAPILRGKVKLNEKALRQKIETWESGIYGLRRKIVTSHPSFQLFFAHVLQSYMIKFDMDMNALPEKYDDNLLARVDILLHYKEWFGTVEGLAYICSNLLELPQAPPPPQEPIRFSALINWPLQPG